MVGWWGGWVVGWLGEVVSQSKTERAELAVGNKYTQSYIYGSMVVWEDGWVIYGVRSTDRDLNTLFTLRSDIIWSEMR